MGYILYIIYYKTILFLFFINFYIFFVYNITTHTYLASLAYFWTGSGPTRKAASATSAKPRLGVCNRLHRTWADLTNIWTQYVQTAPIKNVAKSPKRRPALRKAIGIASMPVPRLPLSRCISVSRSEVGWTSLRCSNGL